MTTEPPRKVALCFQRAPAVLVPKTRHMIGCIGVGIGLWLGVMGSFITFVPGAETAWFALAAIAAATGVLSPDWRTRLAGVGLAGVFAWFAWHGYLRGVEYREWLRQRMPIPAIPPGEGQSP